MRSPIAVRQPVHAVLAALLAIVILSMQWAGLSHRIAHASLQQADNLPSVQLKDGLDKSIEHSCLLFDAASLASALPSPPYLPGLLPAAQVLARWQAFASWDAPLLCHFSSRAPPRI